VVRPARCLPGWRGPQWILARDQVTRIQTLLRRARPWQITLRSFRAAARRLDTGVVGGHSAVAELWPTSQKGGNPGDVPLCPQVEVSELPAADVSTGRAKHPHDLELRGFLLLWMPSGTSFGYLTLRSRFLATYTSPRWQIGC
jgi:hypothetical protein